MPTKVTPETQPDQHTTPRDLAIECVRRVAEASARLLNAQSVWEKWDARNTLNTPEIQSAVDEWRCANGWPDDNREPIYGPVLDLGGTLQNYFMYTAYRCRDLADALGGGVASEIHAARIAAGKLDPIDFKGEAYATYHDAALKLTERFCAIPLYVSPPRVAAWVHVHLMGVAPCDALRVIGNRLEDDEYHRKLARDVRAIPWIDTARLEIGINNECQPAQVGAGRTPISRGAGNGKAIDEFNLDNIPPLDVNSSEWVRSSAAASKQNNLPGTFATYRSKGKTAPDQMSGIDVKGQMWRREKTAGSHPYYYAPSLRKK